MRLHFKFYQFGLIWLMLIQTKGDMLGGSLKLYQKVQIETLGELGPNRNHVFEEINDFQVVLK